MSTDDNKKLLTYDDVAREYGFNPSTLRVWVVRRRIPFVRLGPRMVRFERAALERWIEEGRVDIAANG